MKTKTPNALQLWKQIEDSLVPRLRLSPIDRAVYSHLLRHSRLEGKLRLHFSIAWLARGARLSVGATRHALRRLASYRALRLVQRSKAGHVMEVRLPGEIRAVLPGESVACRHGQLPSDANLEELDFLHSMALRDSIHAREGGRCFYCLRHITSSVRCLDHVVPRARLGCDSYRNLVSSCLECNSQKGARPADDFLRALYRDRRLTALELSARLTALDALAAGKLRPPLLNAANPRPRRGRPPLNPAALAR